MGVTNHLRVLGWSSKHNDDDFFECWCDPTTSYRWNFMTKKRPRGVIFGSDMNYIRMSEGSTNISKTKTGGYPAIQANEYLQQEDMLFFCWWKKTSTSYCLASFFHYLRRALYNLDTVCSFSQISAASTGVVRGLRFCSIIWFGSWKVYLTKGTPPPKKNNMDGSKMFQK